MIIPESCSLNEGELQPPFLRRKAVVYQDYDLNPGQVAQVDGFLDNIFPGRAVIVSHPTFFEEKDNIHTGRLTSLLSPNGADPITGLLHEKELRLQQLKLAAQLGLIEPEEAESQSQEWNEKPKPTIKQMIIDIDGTVLKMKYEDPFNTSFTNSLFGSDVIGRFGELIDECIQSGITNIDKTTILTKDPMSFVRNPEVCSFLEETYGDWVKNEMLEEFCLLYGIADGEKELNSYFDRYPHLSLGYHVFRWLTHGMVNINKVFEEPDAELPGWISQSVASDVRPVFLTASPRIHALRMLERAGLMEALKNGEISLMTAEDLYHPESLSEMSKAVAIAACTWGEDENALERFREIEKNENKANKMYQTYLKLRERRNDVHVISASQTVSIGDQWESDIEPAKKCGTYAYLVDGPEMVPNIMKYVVQ